VRRNEDDNESEMLGRAQAGDVSAFQQLAQRHAEVLFRCALTLCRDRQRAEDIAQETLVAAWRSLRRFDGRCRFSTWLYGILRHRFLKSCDRQRLGAVEADLSQLNNAATSGPTPAQMAERLEDAARLRRAVAELPDEHRLVIELRFFAGASLDDIAAALGCPLGTVKSRLHHGLEKLRKMDLPMNLFDSGQESSTREP
jgi:RNA polymerase sigma-70 factor (ECF subfamily)